MTGIGTLSGWDVPTAGCDIYYGGHLLAEVGISAITDGTYRCARSGGNLYVYGASAGDTWDVIAADGWNENFVRLGTIATDSDVENAYNTEGEEIWPLIRDLVAESGQYVVFRRTSDYVYLDISATPKARGSEDVPFASLHIGDDFSNPKLKQNRDPPYSCVLGQGADYENVIGQRYGRGDPTPPGRAWIETPYQLADSRVSPDGNLDGATDDYYDELHQHAPIDIDLHREGLLPGDWCELDLGDGDVFTAQLRSLEMTSGGPDRATFGAPDLSIIRTYLERTETTAIEAYREYVEDVADGEAIRYGFFGATETFSGEFVTIDWAGADVPIMLSLSVLGPNDVIEGPFSVFYVIDINSSIIKIPWQPWGPNPLTELDIGPYCNLDASTNSISISIEDPAGWVPDDYVFKLTIEGLGADSAADSITLTINKSTLNDMSTATYFTRGTIGETCYSYSVSNEDIYPSVVPTVRVWVKSKGTTYSEWYSNAGWVYWYGQCRTKLVVGGNSYYGSWHRYSSATWSYTDYAENPDTGEAWTWEEINSISAGGCIRVYCTYSGPIADRSDTWLYDAYVEVLP